MRGLVAILVVLIVAVAPSPARADVASDLHGLIDEVARAWAERQEPDGLFGDPLLGRSTTAYGNGMIGYAMLRSAARTGDERLAAAGARAIEASVPHWRPNGFEIWTAQAALRRAGSALPAALRSRLESEVTGFRRLAVADPARACMRKPSCYSNLKLLDALTTLSALNTGLRGTDPRARLSRPRAARRAARRMIERRIPAVMDGGVRALTAGGGLGGSVLSDPVRNPLAYTALSSFMLLRALDELGRPDPRAEEAALDALDALTALAAPDGDLSYMGRGQGQVWVPATMLAAGLEGARRYADSPVRARRYLGLALLAWHNLESRHRTGSILRLVPGAPRSDMRGIDGYAGSVTYDGLALFALQHAADVAASGLPALDPHLPPAATGPLRVLDDDATGLAVVRARRVWFAVHERMTHPSDLRSDFGLLSLKVARPDGWHDVLAPRPLTKGRGARRRGMGPVLVRDGRAWQPYGRTIRAGRRGTVTVRGDWRALSGDVLRENVVLARFRPLRDGVEVKVPAEPGDRFRTAVFAPAGTGEFAGRSIRTETVRATFGSVARTRVRGGFHSAQAPDLDRLEVTSAPVEGPAFRFSVRAR